MKADIFNELFVLELANNHWGEIDRGLKIVTDFGRIVRFNNVKAANQVTDKRCRFVYT